MARSPWRWSFDVENTVNTLRDSTQMSATTVRTACLSTTLPGALGQRHAISMRLVRADDVGELVVGQEVVDGLGAEADRAAAARGVAEAVLVQHGCDTTPRKSESQNNDSYIRCTIVATQNPKRVRDNSY
jgi:hypothetical protein